MNDVSVKSIDFCGGVPYLEIRLAEVDHESSFWYLKDKTYLAFLKQLGKIPLKYWKAYSGLFVGQHLPFPKTIACSLQVGQMSLPVRPATENNRLIVRSVFQFVEIFGANGRRLTSVICGQLRRTNFAFRTAQ